MEMSGTAAKRAASISSIAASPLSASVAATGRTASSNAGRVTRERREDRRRREAEHARVPHVVAGRNILARCLERWLLDESAHGKRRRRSLAEGVTALDVAESRFRAQRGDAERDERSAAREIRCAGHRRGESGLVANQMIGGKHDDDCIASVACLDDERRKGDGRCRVAAEGLEQVGRSGRGMVTQPRVDVLGMEVILAVGDGEKVARLRAAPRRAPRSSRAASRRPATASRVSAHSRATTATGACRRRRRG